MRESRDYTRGYMPKIEYWTGVLAEAVRMEDIHEIDRAHNKLDFFIQKQFELKWAAEKESETVA
jgi:hypothetical protein